MLYSVLTVPYFTFKIPYFRHDEIWNIIQEIISPQSQTKEDKFAKKIRYNDNEASKIILWHTANTIDKPTCINTFKNEYDPERVPNLYTQQQPTV